MTDPTGSAQLAAVMAAARFVLLDFDGPVCDVFAGRPARDVADDLRQHLISQLDQQLTGDAATTHDPLMIVRAVAEIAPHLSSDIDAALRKAELDAVATATLTPGVTAFIEACTRTGRPLAIVSNNSAPAVAEYLHRHDLTGAVQYIAGRDPDDPRRMKPATFLLDQAVTELAADPTATVLVGDSTTDVEAARAAGVLVIGYVNKPKKTRTLAGADALTTSIDELASVTV